ncbi:Uma2 family endonuclease [Ferruginibacter sp. HRS2-29]|uniref:Uma2 family endonuclease n=1 Tax=Ferruginibacter sp. HRS2-29 TaxID=2487334 RepID=UPI0020CD706E|nr:Uma2 family endonuclease [Ferruginibacter sp. HRS2-29]MCP9751511.1 Uma2 family endonuclease [Ferruginibacter sp. HRS2-29]
MENVTEEPAVKYNHFSPEEYLAMEREATEKHEYYQGEIFVMTGASREHNEIFSNLFTEIGYKLKGKGCKPYGADFRTHVQKNTLYTYPDMLIICGEPELTDNHFDTVTNPSVIIEILSKSTRDYDIGKKFMLYRDIPSLKEYIVVDSEKMFVQNNTKIADKSWQMTEYNEADESLIINTVQIGISLKDIYKAVTFK